MITVTIAMIVFGYALVYYAIAQITGKGDQLTGLLGLGLPGTTR